MLSAMDPADWIESTTRDAPQRLFIKTPAGRELSYAALREQSGRFASALMRRGVGPGDRVAVQADKSLEAVLPRPPVCSR
jgi:malonyl-CoA/methylmalonyl-CoA synthetase